MAILVEIDNLGTLTELKTAIGNWLHRADYVNFVDDLILVAEKWIFRNVRIPEMEVAFNIEIVGGVAPWPEDYIALKFAYMNSNPTVKLDRKGADYVHTAYPDRATRGTARVIASDRKTFIFGPVPADGDRVRGTYYKRPESIFQATNDIIADHFDLYLFASLAEAAPYIRDDARVAMWTSKRDGILASINAETLRERHSGGTLSIVAA